jgi:hypothetical protein
VWSRLAHRRKGSLRVASIVGAVLLFAATPISGAQDTAETAQESSPSRKGTRTGVVSAGLYTQYLWRGRDYTLADAPVAVMSARAVWDASVLAAHVRLRTINAIARRGSPWEAAAADTVQLESGISARVPPGGVLEASVGLNVSFYYGPLRAMGPSYGIVGVEPRLAIAAPYLWGSPQLSAVMDVTPDQVGWRSGLEWFPEFAVPWGSIRGYAGAFRPHNYMKQKSRSFLGELVRGRALTALVSLIPSDVTIGAATLITIAPGLAVEPQAELLLVLNRPQNPAHVVPAAAVTVHYGALSAVPRSRTLR